MGEAQSMHQGKFDLLLSSSVTGWCAVDVAKYSAHCLLQALKTIEKKGLSAMAREAGLDLSKLPYTDVSKNRLEYLAKKEPAPPMPRKIAVRRMQNPEKLAASKKKPLVAKYLLGNRVYLTRDE